MSGGPPTESPAAASGQPLAPPGSPSLPPTAKRADHEFDRAAEPTVPGVGAAAPVYRTEAQRAKSVYKRANPWYRRLARGVIGLVFLAGGAAALWFGARELQDYLNRDRLPSAGADIPTYQTTTFSISSAAPSPELDGTLEIDVNTRAFEFTSNPAPGEPQIHVVSPDGTRVLVQDGTTWRAATDADTTATQVARAIPFLVGVDTADDILINRMRNGYVDLVEQETEGVDDDALERYTITIDIDQYNADQPLQWESFQQEVVPGVGTSGVAELTFWLDTDDMLVRLYSPATDWSWERLEHTDAPIDLPADALAAAG